MISSFSVISVKNVLVEPRKPLLEVPQLSNDRENVWVYRIKNIKWTSFLTCFRFIDLKQVKFTVSKGLLYQNHIPNLHTIICRNFHYSFNLAENLLANSLIKLICFWWNVINSYRKEETNIVDIENSEGMLRSNNMVCNHTNNTAPTLLFRNHNICLQPLLGNRVLISVYKTCQCLYNITCYSQYRFKEQIYVILTYVMWQWQTKQEIHLRCVMRCNHGSVLTTDLHKNNSNHCNF